MQEQLLISQPKSKVFHSLSEVKVRHPGWQYRYPVGLLLSAAICVGVAYFLYLLPGTSEYDSLHRGENTFLQFLAIWLALWVIFGIISLLFSLFDRKKLFLQGQLSRFRSHIAPIRLWLHLYGGVAIIIAIAIGVQDMFFLHRFQAVPLALTLIFAFVAFWPDMLIFASFLLYNVVGLFLTFRKGQNYETILAGSLPSKITSPDTKDSSQSVAHRP